ncbi:MAG: hypothetical protein FWD34_03370 [Oscillospiraceae bacterium]|nr:hypothetical protein [Oscillospiraceae bacterium]
MAVQANIIDVVEKLSDDRKGIIYKLALDMLSAQQSEDFDSFSSEDIKKIQEARKRVGAGDCISFSSAGEMVTHFGVQ